ncbi:hypothetical protein FGL86_04825 [Pistricoccus aurantiacus]|uniref:Uncharacterized protein n=1 Tax=Pistricoccus aurantiacus TaxID=1883414 RepID=A0A5B8SV00_9GAMM|nr:hypothetical protein [Pistricoccus aurantiacus]QEA38468.1 hypothetical protein FGL86_04825 [Pistricoccus aurantiacus]
MSKRAIALRDITLVEGGASLDALLALIAKLEDDYRAASTSMQAMAIFKLDDDAPSASNMDTAPDTKPVSFESIIKGVSDAKPATQEYDWQSF